MHNVWGQVHLQTSTHRPIGIWCKMSFWGEESLEFALTYCGCCGSWMQLISISLAETAAAAASQLVTKDGETRCRCLIQFTCINYALSPSKSHVMSFESLYTTPVCAFLKCRASCHLLCIELNYVRRMCTREKFTSAVAASEMLISCVWIILKCN